MVDASSSIPQRRASDLGPRARLRHWWTENGVQVVVFALLAVIVAGEASDYFNDRQQAERDEFQSCVIANLSESSSESLRRLRIQAPVIEAAGDLLTAATPEERRAIEAELRVALAERDEDLGSVADLPAPEDCAG